MFLDSTKTNVNISEVLEEILVTEMVSYIERIININDGAEDRITVFLSDLTTEFLLMCSSRKFTVLNTNVVRGNQSRILGNDTLRSFYFEMFKSVVYRLCLDYSETDKTNILKALVESARLVPCTDTPDYGKQNPLILNGQDFKNLCGTVFVDKAIIDQYLGANQWYLMVILANICAPKLLENVKTLSSIK
jgi:hypothetical protein